MKTLHQKIKELKLRSKPTEHFRSKAFEDPEFIDKLERHMEGVRAKREKELTETQKIICFCVWGVRDTYGTGWIKGAFSKSIKDRGPKSRANQKIALCWQHNLCDPIGKVIDIWEDDFGAYAIVDFDTSVENGERALNQINSGILNGYSFGFEHIWESMEYEEKTNTIWVKEAALYELSPVTFASIKETHTVRGIKDFETRKMAIDEQTKDFIKGLPSGKQLEFRQILDEHITLAKYQPEEEPSLDKGEPQNGKLNILGTHVSLNNL